MIEFDNFCILHMPRCGGSYIQELFDGAERQAPGHEGWSYFAPFDKDVYGLIREPKSWYLSLHAYCMENDLVWKRVFGVADDDDIQTALRKWITGSHAVDDVVEVPQMEPVNIYRQMQDMNIGFWSWWVLHMYGVNGGHSRKEELVEDMTLLWLSKRDRDLAMLKARYGLTENPPSEALDYSINTSERPEVDVFDVDLTNIFTNKDAFIYATALLQPIPS